MKIFLYDVDRFFSVLAVSSFIISRSQSIDPGVEAMYMARGTFFTEVTCVPKLVPENSAIMKLEKRQFIHGKLVFAQGNEATTCWLFMVFPPRSSRYLIYA